MNKLYFFYFLEIIWFIKEKGTKEIIEKRGI
jgi:hypothetical protein